MCQIVVFGHFGLHPSCQGMEDKDGKWEMITSFWVEMLAYAAFHCRGKYHGQQLSWGGELLTRVASYGTLV